MTDLVDGGGVVLLLIFVLSHCCIISTGFVCLHSFASLSFLVPYNFVCVRLWSFLGRARSYVTTVRKVNANGVCVCVIYHSFVLITQIMNYATNKSSLGWDESEMIS